MRLVLCGLTVLALALSPAASMAQSTTADAPKPGTGHMMKDSWITTKAKSSLVFDKLSLKEAGISVRSDNSVVTLIGTAPDRKAEVHASDVVRGVPGVRAVRNELAQKD